MVETNYKPKFNIGDEVFNKVAKRGSSEPSICEPGTKLTVRSIQQNGNFFLYTCGYDGYEFTEDELMTKEEYIETL